MSEVIKLCKCGKSPKIASNIDSYFKRYTVVCPLCRNRVTERVTGRTTDRVAKKWNRKR